VETLLVARKKKPKSATDGLVVAVFLIAIGVWFSLSQSQRSHLIALGVSLLVLVIAGVVIAVYLKKRKSVALQEQVKSDPWRNEPYLTSEPNIDQGADRARTSQASDPYAVGKATSTTGKIGMIDTTRWNIDLLRVIEWKGYEKLCAGYFERLGFRAEVGHFGADGGVDIRLYRDGSPQPGILVQCKSWRNYKVGVREVRELLGVMTAANVVEGIFMTTSVFTQDAKAFAMNMNMHLIDGHDLLAKIQELSPEGAAELLAMATAGDFMTPSCPSCGIKLIERQGKGRGPFWGCRNYPRCRSTIEMAKA
jgi:restriction system protein